MATTIRLLSEKAAMDAVGMRSVNRYTYAVQGDGVREIMDWADGKALCMTMQVHWDGGEILAAYVMFARVAHTDERVKEINSALTLFHLQWKKRDDLQWIGSVDVPKAVKAF